MRDKILSALRRSRQPIAPKELARELGAVVVTEDVSDEFRAALHKLISQNEVDFTRDWKLNRIEALTRKES